MAPNNGLKHRGNKLHHFVVGDAADDEFQTALVTQDDRAVQDDGVTPDGALEPTRQELAENLRLPMPQPRHAARHLRERSLTSHQSSRSPVRSRHASPRPAPSHTETADDVNGLFAPSILGEDFMRSEASTPYPEFDQDENTVTRRRPEAHTKKPSSRWSSGRLDMLEESPKFVTNDEGFMQVVKAGRKYTPTALRDGFTRDDYYQREAVENYDEARKLHRPIADGQIGLPIRTEPRRLTKAKEERVLYSARAASPVYEPEQRAQGRDRGVRRSPERYVQPVRQPPSEADDNNVRITARTKPFGTETGIGTVNAEEPTQYAMRDGSRLRKRHRENPDYDDQVLSSMSYKELRNEAFDFDPTKAALSGVTNDGTHDLPTKLEQRRHRGEEEQRQFFASMPIKEWEESGDWFVDQFAELMKKMRNARRDKRRVIQEFEDEAERREEVVRTRSEAIDRKLGKMRQDGLKVVADVSS